MDAEKLRKLHDIFPELSTDELTVVASAGFKIRWEDAVNPVKIFRQGLTEGLMEEIVRLRLTVDGEPVTPESLGKGRFNSEVHSYDHLYRVKEALIRVIDKRRCRRMGYNV